MRRRTRNGKFVPSVQSPQTNSCSANRYINLSIIAIPFNERSEACPFCMKIGHYFQKSQYPIRGIGIFNVDGDLNPSKCNSPVDCCSIPARRDRHHNLIKSLHLLQFRDSDTFQKWKHRYHRMVFLDTSCGYFLFMV